MSEAEELLQEAENCFKERKLEEAVQFYHEAGLLFRHDGDAVRAAYAFERGALCEKVRTGIEPLLMAASLSELCAAEIEKTGEYYKAHLQYRDSALLYEREGDFENYSRCYVASHDAYFKYLWKVVRTGKKFLPHGKERKKANLWDRIRAFVSALFGGFAKVLWGYGEKPLHTVISAFVMIFVCAVIYDLSDLVAFYGERTTLSFADAFYLSGITFSTLGFGDYVPLGWVRMVSFIESLSGFVLVPLFVVALTRRYLRVER